ncbi:MAG TPA: DNA replication and repair protein RecF [Methylomirabilota bacterium]|nr:DNA replication and repair protein RecF [Methylomirabilota bacterium]
MRLRSISLENFRNYSKISVSIDADLVLILGDNASGKTNFLESIYFLSRLKSFRAPDELIVKQLEEYFNIEGEFGSHQMRVVVQKVPSIRRSFKINGQKVSKSVWQSFPTVLFVPNDLNLFILGPVARRKFLDEILTQKSQEYAISLVSLDHILKQKSALLEMLNQGQGDLAQLEFWNQQLAQAASVITKYRVEFIEFLRQNFDSMIEALMGKESKFKIVFKNQAETEQQYLECLRQHQEAEIRSQTNLVGPHRDDFLIEKDSTLNIYNSSRGELRTQILALKLLQAKFLTSIEQKPIILLDDVFSELDETRRRKLIETLEGHQIFITSTEEHHLPNLTKDVLILKVAHNQITPS